MQKFVCLIDFKLTMDKFLIVSSEQVRELIIEHITAYTTVQAPYN